MLTYWTGETAHDIAARYGFMGAEQDSAFLGQGLLEFEQQVSADPKFASAWDEIHAQLKIENADIPQIDAAKLQLTDAYESLSKQFGVYADEALVAAKKYTKLGQTILGAASMIQGLVAMAEQPSVTIPQVTQFFTGSMIGTMVSVGVATGIVTAGIGAAIVGTVGALFQIMQSVGLFGGAPAGGVDVCLGMKCNPAPSWTIGCDPKTNACPCLCVWNASGGSNQIVPGSTEWRSFPNPADAGDAVWFASALLAGDLRVSWKGLDFGRTLTINPAGASRPIDEAFPSYYLVESVLQPLSGPAGIALAAALPAVAQPGGDLWKAYAAAWKANAEYAYNGLNIQPDWAVLKHTLMLWNRAHQGPAASVPMMFISSVVPDFRKLVPGDDPLYLPDGSLGVNSGALIMPGQAAAPAALTDSEISGLLNSWQMSVQNAARYGAPPPPYPQALIDAGVPAPTGTAPAPTSAAPVVVGSVLTAAAAGSLWLWLGQPLTIAALKAAVDHGVRAAGRALGL